MAGSDIEKLKASSGFPVEFFKGTTHAITVTVKDSAGSAQDISGWIDGSTNFVYCIGKASLADVADLFKITCTHVTDGTDGKFRATFTSTHLASVTDGVILQFLRYNSVDYSNPFRRGIWSTRIRESVL